jgi:hypothetical protein
MIEGAPASRRRAIFSATVAGEPCRIDVAGERVIAGAAADRLLLDGAEIAEVWPLERNSRDMRSDIRFLCNCSHKLRIQSRLTLLYIIWYSGVDCPARQKGRKRQRA